VVAGGAHDRPHRADDDIGLSVLYGVAAAKRDDVDVVGGERGQLVLPRRPEVVEGVR
jgi:hypothetical protein